VFGGLDLFGGLEQFCPSGPTDHMPPLLFYLGARIDPSPEGLYSDFCNKQVTVDKVQK